MPADYHIHLHYSQCASPLMTVRDILKTAEALELDCVGLVIHVHPHTDITIFSQAKEEISSALSDYRGEVLLGVEAELLDHEGNSTLPEKMPELFDYTMLALGHVHLPWVKIDFPSSGDIFLAREAESLLKAIENKNVDILAHTFIYSTLYQVAPHLIGRLWPHKLPVDLVDALAYRLMDCSTVMEFHCRDLFVRPERLGGAEFVKSYMEFLTGLRDRGVNFVPGSDAHYLDQIGRTQNAPDWAQGRLKLD